jgi:hypothetical protein
VSFTIVAGLASAVTPGHKSHRTHDHILLSLSRLRQSGGPGRRMYNPPPPSRNRVAQLYSQAPGSLFIASYDSQSSVEVF